MKTLLLLIVLLFMAAPAFAQIIQTPQGPISCVGNICTMPTGGPIILPAPLPQPR